MIENCQEDYIFRYKLTCGSKNGKRIYQHRPTEFIRVLLENLLNIAVLLEENKEVKISSFRLLNNSEEMYPIFSKDKNLSASVNPAEKLRRNDLDAVTKSNYFYQDDKNASFYEPRIALIKKLIESVISLVDFENEGLDVKVDGFRLKNLQDWIVKSSGDPSEVLEYAGSHCNCNCTFCCNKGNHPSVAISNRSIRTVQDEYEEIKTRIKYFSPASKRSLFASAGCIYEVTESPFFMDVLKLLRQKSSSPIRITTNGGNLTRDFIAELARFNPVYLYLSLNSTSTSRRRNLMKDHKPEIAINAPPFLVQHRIPYSAVIVPWPVVTIDEMLDDLSSTINYIAQFKPHLIQINLPGYSEYFSPVLPFDTQQIWGSIISRVRELRRKVDSPIVVMPTMYEENMYLSWKNIPQIIGLVKNSPPYLAGLQKGDIILKINGLVIQSRAQACDLLYTLTQSDISETTLIIDRDSQKIERKLDLTQYSYPYNREIDPNLGVVFMGTGLRMSYIERLREIVQKNQAKHVLFLSSSLVKPAFEQCLLGSRVFSTGQVKLDIEIPQNRFFSGNIFMGDLLVVEDFVDCITEYIAKKKCKPDMVVIPSSPFNLSGWGRDLTGECYLNIERKTGIKTELLECATIYN